MGLTAASVGRGAMADSLPELQYTDTPIVALAGMPNVGKSTVFNALTGLHQHTGNWAGKTVANAVGITICGGTPVTLVDLPGTYSLRARSAEETVARDFLCFDQPDAAVVVCDAACLERGVTFVRQVMEAVPRVLLCVNLMDEAQRRGVFVDCDALEQALGIPVVGAAARNGTGLEQLKCRLDQLLESPEPARLVPELPETLQSCVQRVAEVLPTEQLGELSPQWTAARLLEPEPELHQAICDHCGLSLSDPALAEALETAGRLLPPEQFADQVIAAGVLQGQEIAERVCTASEQQFARDRWLDRIFTGKFGVPVMLLLLGVILWITMVGANYPSAWLSAGFAKLGEGLRWLLDWLHAPWWLSGVIADGAYTVLTWVISVMLPPMAIFFPLFTLLEDLGYLPRVAFNLDKRFQHACACGKQSLTMCMGFGCNAAGVTGCRIIDSPRERLIAILTNNFVPCNGRFPTMITCISLFFAVGSGLCRTLASAGILLCLILLGIGMTFGVSWLLSRTLLRGMPSSFALELPPYRRPQIGKVLIRSIFDRTLFVLGRACLVAAPAGVLLWLFANCTAGGESFLQIFSGALDPVGVFFGMDGVILLAFLLGFPANEIVLPIALMCYTSGKVLTETGDLGQIGEILGANGWTWQTALCVLLFMLFHFPCSTTCLTIYRETKKLRWTAAAMVIPTVLGLVLCKVVALVGECLG